MLEKESKVEIDPGASAKTLKQGVPDRTRHIECKVTPAKCRTKVSVEVNVKKSNVYHDAAQTR